MYGPAIIERTLSMTRGFPAAKPTAFFQYHSRSDHHSKLACWCIAVDLMCTSNLLRQHVAEGKVTVGVNHEMLDFKLNRKKDLDLVIARPAASSETKSVSLSDIAKKVGVMLNDPEKRAFEALPPVKKQPVGSVLVALEAKACMTEHGKSEPRLYDELNSSHQTVHGANDAAIACGLAIVNFADSFISPGRQRAGLPVDVTIHRQPGVTESVISKVRQLPRRTAPGSDGFDALGIIIISLCNDGTPVKVHTDPPAPQVGRGDTYEEMITRTAALYDFRFSTI